MIQLDLKLKFEWNNVFQLVEFKKDKELNPMGDMMGCKQNLVLHWQKKGAKNLSLDPILSQLIMLITHLYEKAMV